MMLEEINRILGKYNKKEEEIEQLLQERELEERSIVSIKTNEKNKKYISMEEAAARNKQVLSDLETTKGNLRSKAIFSPSEMQWETITRNYREMPSLPVTTYRCHLPIFV